MTSKTEELLNKYWKTTDKSSEQSSLRSLSETTFLAQMRAVILASHADYTTLRKKWSKHILKAFWTILIFEMLFISALGLRFIDYREYTALPQVVIGAFFAHIIGLVVIVANFLFPDSPKSLLPYFPDK